MQKTYSSFRVLHPIGEGLLGPVYRTYDPSRDRLVALKILNITGASVEELRALAEHLQEIAEPQPIHDSILLRMTAGFEAEAAHLLMEYVPGESLVAVLKQKPLPALDSRLAMLDRIAEALDVGARSDLLHGRLNPADVLLAEQQVRITGFGVAIALEQAGLRPPLREAYAAPERIEGRSWGRSADVFALAALARELVVRLPERGEPGEAKPEFSTPSSDGRTNQALEEIFSRGLAQDPAERHASARAFMDALKGCLSVTSGTAAFAVPARQDRVFEDSTYEPSDDRITPATDGVQVTTDADVLDNDQDLTALFPTEVEARQQDLLLEKSEPARETDEFGLSRSAVDRELPPEVSTYQGRAEQDVGFNEIEWQPAREPTSSPRRVFWVVAASLVLGIAIGYVFSLFSPWTPLDRSRSQGEPSPLAIAQGTEVPVEQTPKRAAKIEEPVAEKPTPSSGAASSIVEPPAPAPPRAQLVIRSNPPARVTINGRARGNTPLTLDDLTFGTHNLRLTRPGYNDVVRQVSLTREQPRASVSATLGLVEEDRRPGADTSTTGTLLVESRPSGSRVFLDGRLVGNTPLRIPDVPVGPRTVRIEQNGYQPWSATIRVAAGRRERVAASLTPGGGD